MFSGFNFEKSRTYLFTLLLAICVMLWSGVSFAQLADLDLLEDDDRSFGLSVTRAPDPNTKLDTESAAAILLVPLRYEPLKFEGGFGTYFTRNVVAGEASSTLQWRVQGGPHWGKIGLQFYVEGFWRENLDYAGFLRIGEFDLGRVIVSGGVGTLVRANTETDH